MVGKVIKVISTIKIRYGGVDYIYLYKKSYF